MHKALFVSVLDTGMGEKESANSRDAIVFSPSDSDMLDFSNKAAAVVDASWDWFVFLLPSDLRRCREVLAIAQGVAASLMGTDRIRFILIAEKELEQRAMVEDSGFELDAVLDVERHVDDAALRQAVAVYLADGNFDRLSELHEITGRNS